MMVKLEPQWAFNPFVNIAVGSPWNSQEPDVKSINEAVYEGIRELLRQIKDTPNTAALVLGESGTGKTHLIKRFISCADSDMIFVYVHPFKDHQTMFASLMGEIIRDLEKKPCKNGNVSDYSQLESIVAHVIAAAFENYLERDPDEGGKPFLARIRKEPQKILSFRRSPKWAQLLERTEVFLRERGQLAGPALQRVLGVVFQYLEKGKRDAVRCFLAGLVPNEDDCKLLGIRFDESELAGEAREQRAKDILKTIGVLLHYYRPMILCFDQLENLHTSELAKSFGVLINDLVNEVDNVLPVAFVRPDIWEDHLLRFMDRAPADRLKSQEFVLKGLNLDQALELVRARLDWAYERTQGRRPHEFYPFRKAQLEERLRGRDTPRVVLIEANKLLGESPSVQDPLEVIKESIEAERKVFLEGMEKITVRKDVIVAALRLYFESRKARGGPYTVTSLDTGKKPDLALVIEMSDKRLGSRSVEIIVENEVHWKPIQASLSYLRDRLESKKTDFALFLRDGRSRIPPNKGAMPRTVKVREAFEQVGGIVRYISQPDLAELYALVYTSDKIGSGDISFVADKTGALEKINRDTLEDFLRRRFRSDFAEALESAFFGGAGPGKGSEEKPHLGA